MKKRSFSIPSFCLLTLLGMAVATHAPQAAERSVSLVSPQSQGLMPERLERLTSVMRQEVERGTIPGAVTLVARHGKVVHLQAHGFVDAARTRPMETDTLFRILSMTKPFVSVATMMLVEQGRLSLSDPVTLWLPELKTLRVLVQTKNESGALVSSTELAARAITVHDLLRHTSGFTYTGSSPFSEIRDAYRKADIHSRESNVSPEEFLQRLASIPLAYQPGTRYEYGLSLDVLSVLLERLSGKPLHILLDEMIFRPLQMASTNFEVTESQRARLAEMSASDPLKGLVEKEARVTEDPMNRFRKGAGGAVSTAGDYFRFAQMMLNGGELAGVRLMSRKTTAYMLDDHIVGLPGGPVPGYGFGLGFLVRRAGGLPPSVGSIGEANVPGLGGTFFMFDPTEDVVAIYMAAAPSALDHMLNVFRSVVYGSLLK